MIDDDRFNRLEIIDHRKCSDCGGSGIIVAENYKLSGQLCGRCGGVGVMGRKVIAGGPAYQQPDNVKIQLSIQDDGRTLKIFLSDRNA